MKIAFFEIKAEERSFFENALKEHELFFYDSTIQEELQTVHLFEIVSVFIHSRIDETILSFLPNLRYLQTRSTGYDHVKCYELYARNLKVSNVTGYGGPAVAEFAFSLLLNATRHTHTAITRSQQGDSNYLDLKGIELCSKTIGILGLGTIGVQMAKIASGFGMKILGYTRTHKPIYDTLNIQMYDIDTVLKESNVLMFALPLTPATTGLINKENAKLIRPDTIIINAARCEIIEPSLYNELSNIIATDVCTDIDLAKKRNILYTPHMAYYTSEALQRILDISLINMIQFIEGKTPQNCLKFDCQKEYSA